MSDQPPNVGYIAALVGFCSTLVTAAGAVLAFNPRVVRNKDDIAKLDDKKAEKTEVIALETLMTTRFDNQGREIGELKTGLSEVKTEMKKIGDGVITLLERDTKSRKDDES